MYIDLQKIEISEFQKVSQRSSKINTNRNLLGWHPRSRCSAPAPRSIRMRGRHSPLTAVVKRLSCTPGRTGWFKKVAILYPRTHQIRPKLVILYPLSCTPYLVPPYSGIWFCWFPLDICIFPLFNWSLFWWILVPPVSCTPLSCTPLILYRGLEKVTEITILL